MKVLPLLACCSVSLFAIALPGCSNSEPWLLPVTGASRSMPDASRRAPSWIAPDAASQDLLYVSDVSTVTVYSYPKGKLEGTLRGFGLAGGQCVDNKGDVFVTDTDAGQILEYAHGGKKPVAVLKSPADDPLGCSIDPTTGDLAVASLGFGDAAAVGIYKHARGTPKIYQNPTFHQYWYCGYDAAGNLFVDGINSTAVFEFAELKKGRNDLKSITLNQTIGWPGGVQWDGKYMVIGDQNTPVLYQFVVKGSSGRKVGSTSLGGSDVTAIGDFFILGSELIAPNHCSGSCTGDVLYYSYPAGGLPTKTITNGVRYPHGLSVSRPPPKSS